MIQPVLQQGFSGINLWTGGLFAILGAFIVVAVIAAIMIVLITLFYNTSGGAVLPEYPTAGNDQFGIFNLIIDNYELVFLGVSLLLAASLIGAVALMRGRRTPIEQEEEAIIDG